jgi:hypothetical protein
MKIIDLNNELITLAKEKGYEAVLSDYFQESYRTKNPVFVTASNPAFTFGGGLDYAFTKHFPELCRFKKSKGGGNERISNVCFVITVGDDLQATKETVKSAIKFAIEHTGKDETLCLSGLGTKIGGLSLQEYFEILEELK